MISRYFISFNFAALITFSMFFAMNLLITNGETVLVDNEKRVVVVLPEVRKAEPPKTREEKPVLDEIVPEPEVTVQPIPTPGGGLPGPTTTVITDPAPTIPKSITPFAMGEGAQTPIVRVAPQYPANMASKGIEGYVTVQFSLTINGSVENVIVLESSHRGFERNAVRAVQKFKYKPKVVDGTPVPVTGMTTTLEFKLEK